MLKKLPRVLIVGDGLSAHVLAHRLHAAAVPFILQGMETVGAASPAAWGLLNPVHFRSFGLSYGASWYPESLAFYKALEQKLSQKFVDYAPLEHLDARPEALAHWSIAWESELYSFMEKPTMDSLGNVRIVLSQVAMVSVPTLLQESRRYLSEQGLYHQAWFDWPYPDFNHREPIEHAGKQFDAVVWAQGVRSLESGPFKALPIKPSKGEGIQLSTLAQVEEKVIKHRGMFAFQESPGSWRVGSTYSWRDMRPEPSAEAREELKARFSELTGINDFALVDHWAGFRPASPDRKAIVGQHPLFNQHYALNGMGSKGLLMAPYLAKALQEEMVGDLGKTPKLCSLDRFTKRLINFRE
jgi:hypothetical protein